MGGGSFLMDNLVLLLAPVGLAVVGFGWWWETERVKKLRAAGAALGLHPTDDGLDDLPEGLRAMPLFGLGRSRKAANVMWSERRDYVVFEYAYTTGSGKSSTTHHQTLGAFHSPGRSLPAFTAAPEDLGDWFAELFGGQDIDFPGDPVFSKAYRLTGDDEAAVRDFFSVGGTQYLAARPGWTVHAQGDWLLAYRARRRASPKTLQAFLWDLQGLYGALFGV